MTVYRINAAMNKLTFPSPSQAQAFRGTTMLVCPASFSEWNAYVESDHAAISAKMMAWFGLDTAIGSTAGEIHIVEYPTSRSHAKFVNLLNFTIRSNAAAMRCLEDAGDSSNVGGPQYQPDASFGPRESVVRPLSVGLPARVTSWVNFVTVKIEVGVSQDWGDRNGTLDWKATQWAGIPGVVYVLCISVDKDLLVGSYKLYEVVAPRTLAPHQANAIPIIAPSTVVEMDSRRVLGLQPVEPLPAGFPDPFQIDLFDVLQAAQMEH